MAEVSADFGDGMEKVENHTFIEQTDTKVTFKVRFPKAGIYSVKICAKKLDDTGPYKAVYNYIVHVPVRMKDCEPFPVQYVRLGCKVDGVESGYLVEGEDVSMDVVIPGASSVAAVCDGKITTFTKVFYVTHKNKTKFKLEMYECHMLLYIESLESTSYFSTLV